VNQHVCSHPRKYTESQIKLHVFTFLTNFYWKRPHQKRISVRQSKTQDLRSKGHNTSKRCNTNIYVYPRNFGRFYRSAAVLTPKKTFIPVRNKNAGWRLLSFFCNHVVLDWNICYTDGAFLKFQQSLITIACFKLKLLYHRNQKNKNFHSSKLLSQAVTGADRKRYDVFRFEKLSVLIKMSFRFELLRFFENTWIVVNSPDIWNDLKAVLHRRALLAT